MGNKRRPETEDLLRMAAYRRSMRALGQTARDAANLAEATGDRRLHLVEALPDGESVRLVSSTVRNGTTIYDGSTLFVRDDEEDDGYLDGCQVFDQDARVDHECDTDGSNALGDCDGSFAEEQVRDDEANVLSLAAARARRAHHPAGADRT